MRSVIAVESCHKNRTIHQVIRRTWAKDFPGADVRFFIGNPLLLLGLEQDEVQVDVDDDWDHLVYKTYAIIKWALNNGYDFLFKCDTDTFIAQHRIMSSGFEKYDYVGRYMYPDPISEMFTYAHGGAGYWLSKEAMTAIANTQEEEFCLFDSKLNHEDTAVGRILGLNKIFLHIDDRYCGEPRHGQPKFGNDYITTHRCKPEQLEYLYYSFNNNVCVLRDKRRVWLDSKGVPIV